MNILQESVRVLGVTARSARDSANSSRFPRTIGVIPARGGSKSIPHKNIALVAGKPLIYYTIEAAKRAKLLDAFIVSTDDPAIAEVARRYGADVPFLRPSCFSRDTSPDIEFMRHALGWLKKHRGWEPEIVVNLRPTAPLRTPEDIDAVVALMQKTGCDSVRTVSLPYPYNPFKMWRMNIKTAALTPLLPTKNFSIMGTDVPRQLLPKVWWQNGLVDATRAKFIWQNKVYGPDIRGLVIDPERVVDIDEPKDLIRAGQLIQRFRVHSRSYSR